jgi:hypothetical protein
LNPEPCEGLEVPGRLRIRWLDVSGRNSLGSTTLADDDDDDDDDLPNERDQLL